ncbi:putative RING-type E3 ubiquitin transferase C3H69 isoform X2 [Hibiscus syriacus]|uniref:putative RING-type E3 ubiquitin transferase C3H69 isoform X2 n=1 Tax=Hibiscus syriacus TaxID=106335 RepID=UPI0019245B90|nr:putative RING-type E3 ubiquitin transferase C3H69 isoform X2 [Hibiscus syriacus]
MPKTKRVFCKFFAHGACFKGENCEFSHDWKDPPNNICTYYQKGICSYGSQCRYEHVKASQSDLSASSSSTKPRQFGIPDSVPLGPSTSTFRGSAVLSAASPEFPGSNGGFLPPARNAWNLESERQDLSDDGDVLEPRSGNVADRSICSFTAGVNCPRGEKCHFIHGDLCPTCGKHCLHPFRPEEREEHIKMCEKKQNHLDALKYSQEIECSVCLDRVLSKLTAAERKFGLLSECDHPFCISCIRNWRSSSPSSGMDVNTALRTCPICRKLSYFVIPSVIWYSTPEEKKEIVDSYKARLRSIDCKHFNFGNGNCPFGTSCFYKHAYQDGRLEEVALRHLGAEDGHTIIAKNIRLSNFLSDLHIG